MKFTLEKTSKNARAATIELNGRVLHTPVFMPVGTLASVKALDSEDLHNLLKPQIILANTYHLYLRPTSSVVAHHGGLRGFSKFDGLFLTDSGGFQAFSLSSAKTKDHGVIFQSHIDGSRHEFTPQKVIEIQHDLGSDIMMVLDDLPALPATNQRIVDSIDRTTRWAEESLKFHRTSAKSSDQSIFAIVQGGTSCQFRTKSAHDLTSLDHDGKSFDGFAIGGLSVGEPPAVMYETLDFTTPLLPTDKPRYLMGVGTPNDLIEGIDKGVDMFDCVMPSRNARNGQLFTTFGKINIKRPIYALDKDPIDPACNCHTCQNYSRGYLSHLYRSGEITYFRLATIHNLYYYLTLMREARLAILADQWSEFKRDFYAKREQA